MGGEWLTGSVFNEVAALLVLAAATGLVGLMLRQPLIVVAIMVTLGYRLRTGFLAGLTVAQISEFSLIFMAMGVTIGHVGEDALGLVTVVGLITIAASTYMITCSHQLHAVCEPLPRPFLPRASAEAEEEAPAAAGDHDVIIFGLGRYGDAIGRRLERRGYRVLGVDYSPMSIRHWRQDGLGAVYGDVSDPEPIATLPLAGVRWVISTIRDRRGGVDEANPGPVLVQALRQQG